MSYKTRDGKTHQSTVLMGDNGLPIDGIATIAGSYVFLEIDGTLEYTSGGAIVTLPVGSDLTSVATAKARYTGRYVLIAADSQIYYINRQSINVADRTFQISRSDSSQVNPVALDLSSGWQIAEADIVNRMATTSAAKIDRIDFRDMHFQMQLDGDPVTLNNQSGVGINPATEETQLANNQELQDINGNIGRAYVSTPVIINLQMPIQGDEYYIDLPINAKRFKIKSRNPALLKIAFSPTATEFLTLKPGVVYEEKNLVTTAALSIYIKSNKPNTVIEAVYWE